MVLLGLAIYHNVYHLYQIRTVLCSSYLVKETSFDSRVLSVKMQRVKICRVIWKVVSAHIVDHI